MELKPGDKLGPYEIVSLLGKGGMGEVWRARDSQIGRDVAIKVSAQQFTDRFEREVRAIGALNHPNICTLYHVGPNYLVMELIEGPTLADRIAQGAIPLEEALAIAKQIADALEAAHERNIVHRDLKPANIKIRPDGSVKVLDFGLAKAGGAQEVTADSPTMMPGTQIGMILGTAGYMSPEQARGKEVDKRADIWAFGVVLYEMVTGKRLFDGATVSDSLAAILKEEPDLTFAPAKTRRLLQACLEKEPRRRLRDIADAWRLLEDALASPAPPSRRWIWAGGLLALIAAVALVTLALLRPAPAEPYRLALNPPAGLQFEFANVRGGSAISPDGRRVALVAGDALWVRPLDSDTSVRLPGTEGAYYPFWSPDQHSIGFFVGTKLMRVDLPSGPVSELAALETVGRNGSWNANGTILFSENNRSIFRIPSAGGKPELLTRFDEWRQEGAHYHPSFFPDGDHYLYMIRSRVAANNGIYVGSLKDPALKRRVATVLSNAAYVPPSREYPGYLVFDRQGVLVAQPFDAAALRTTGEPEVLSSSVGLLLNNQFANFSASRNGTVLFGTAGTPKIQLAWLDRSGKATPLASPPDYFSELRLSPDGSRVLLEKRSGTGASIWTLDFRRGALSMAAENGAYAAWSADDRRIMYDSARSLLRKDLDSAQPAETVAPLPEGLGLTIDWSPDEQSVVLPEPRGLYVISLAEGGKGNLLSRTASARSPRFSPDGKWLAYASYESGASEVFVQDFPAGRTRIQVSNHGGTDPAWRRDGKELFYLTMEERLTAVDVRSGTAGLEFGVPHALFSISNLALNLGRSWDADADGQRFLCLIPVDRDPRDNQLTVLLNWRAGRRR